MTDLTAANALPAAARTALLEVNFDEQDNYGHFQRLPEDKTARAALSAFLEGYLAQPDADARTVLDGFEFADGDASSDFAALLRDLRQADGEIIVFSTADLPTEAELAKKDKQKLNVLKLEETHDTIPWSAIRAVPGTNPRKTTRRAGLHKLALSIVKTGLRHDIALRPHPSEDGAYSIIYGYRRHAAIGYAIEQGWAKLEYPVRARVIHANDAQARVLALAENDGRENVDPLDEAESYVELMRTNTLESIAKQTGLEGRDLKAKLQVALHAGPTSKARYRAGEFEFDVLRALSCGSAARQDEYLKNAMSHQLNRPNAVLNAMTAQEFKLQDALFTLEEYKAAGGEVEEHLFFADITRLMTREVIERLQREKLEAMKTDFERQGYAEVVVISGDATLWDSFTRAAINAPLEERCVVIELNDNLSVRVTKDLARLGTTDSSTSAPLNAPTSSAGHSSGSNAQPPTPTNQNNSSREKTNGAEARSVRFTDAGTAMIRQLRTNALHGALLERGNHHLFLAIAAYGLLSSRETLVQRRTQTKDDPITNPALRDAVQRWGQTLPGVTASPQIGLVGTHSVGLELLQALVVLRHEDLQELFAVLVTSSVADWVVTPGGSRRTQDIDSAPLPAALAQLLEIHGGEAWVPTEAYYRSVTFYKDSLESHVKHVVGNANSSGVMERKKGEITAELLQDVTKLHGFTPPELRFIDTGVRLEPSQPLETTVNLEEAPFLPGLNFEDQFNAHAISAD
jgi:ParB/RepB/Spo0J family partition protein